MLDRNMPTYISTRSKLSVPFFSPGGAPTRRSAARRLPRRRRYHCDPMSVLPTTQQQRLATFRAPACQRYYASRLAAESPHPSTFDLPRGIFHPSTTGTKMLVKRAWTYEDVAADPDTFELVRHPSREPFTLPVWVQHALRTILAAQGPAARLAKARPHCAGPHGAAGSAASGIGSPEPPASPEVPVDQLVRLLQGQVAELQLPFPRESSCLR